MNPEALRRFITTTAADELTRLRKYGGRGLSNLAVNMYLGFALSPGEDMAIAAYLSSLPMGVRDRLPSFLYPMGLWGMQPLLRVKDRRANGTLGFTIRSTAGNQLDVSPANTPIVEAFLDGAKKIHEARSVRQSRGMLRLHLLQITDRTAKLKGLLW